MTEHADPEYVFEVLDRKVFGVVARAGADVVDENVDPAELGIELGEKREDVGFLSMSAWMETALRPSAAISSVAAASPASSKSQIRRSAPCRANPLAIARPMPLPAPVTIATRPERSKLTCSPPLFSRFHFSGLPAASRSR